MHNKNVGESFFHAFEGFSHVVWTQRHVRIQLFIVVLVLMLAYVMKLEPLKVLFVLSAVTAVLVAELFNTAIEVVVNMVTETFHPLAKIAKDVAAAGVLIATTYAIMVGATVFFDVAKMQQWLLSQHSVTQIAPERIVVIVLLGVALVSILVPLAKVRIGHGTILRGGAVSGHTAVAFILFAAVAINSKYDTFTTLLALVLAILVAQSRVEGKIHTLAEVLWGATVALVMMALLMLFS